MFVDPLTTLSQNAPLIGWGTVMSFVVWLWRKSVQAVVGIQDGKRRLEAVENNINTLTTNHLSHIETDIREVNQKHDKTTEILSSIDRNIAILVDRSQR